MISNIAPREGDMQPVKEKLATKEEFVGALVAAVEKYESDNPEKRKDACAEIKATAKNQRLNCQQIAANIKEIIDPKTLETGITLFGYNLYRTGNSSLRNLLGEVLDNSKFSEQNLQEIDKSPHQRALEATGGPVGKTAGSRRPRPNKGGAAPAGT